MHVHDLAYLLDQVLDLHLRVVHDDRDTHDAWLFALSDGQALHPGAAAAHQPDDAVYRAMPIVGEHHQRVRAPLTLRCVRLTGTRHKLDTLRLVTSHCSHVPPPFLQSWR